MVVHYNSGHLTFTCLFLLIAFLCINIHVVHGYGYYVDVIPNGRIVPCPSTYCSGTCEGFGHVNSDGTPGCSGGSHPLHALNQFGKDWGTYKLEWNYDMCVADSDGDGYTNGDELGDPCCIWSTGATPQRIFPIMHPGYADTSAPFPSCQKNGVPTFNISITSVGVSTAVFEWYSPSSSCVCDINFEFSVGVLQRTIDQNFKTMNMQSINLTALDPDTEYNIIANASNLAGGSPMQITFRTLPVSQNAPAKPQPPQLSTSTPNSLDIEWGAFSGSDPSFVWELEVDNGAGGGGEPGILSLVYTGKQTSFSVQNLKQNTTYGMRLRGSNSYGDGFPSDVVFYTTAPANESVPHGYVNDDGTYRVYWTIVNDEITFQITAATTGWVGLGVGPTPTMLNSDVFMGGFDGTSGTGYLNDRWSIDRVTPKIDIQQDLTLLTSTESASGTSISFKRKLVTTDKNGEDVAITNADIYLMWAYGGMDSLSSTSLPTHTQRGAVLVNFVSGSTVKLNTDDLFNTHSALNYIAWMVLIPLGSIIARYFRTKMSVWWFRFHVALQTLGFVLSMIGFVLAFVAVETARTPHFANLHSFFGFFLFLFLLVQTGLGLLSHLKYDPKRRTTPLYPDIIHRWVGLSTMGFAFVTVGLGFYYNTVQTGTWYLGGITLAYILLAAMVFEYF